MKKLLLVFAIFTLFSCDDDETAVIPTEETNTIIGRWHLVGFDNTMYDFQTNLRYTIYSDNGTFGATETDAIPNPNPWSMENDKLVIDLFFGNVVSYSLNYKCSGNVVELIDEEGEINSILFREGYDYATCN